MNCSFFLCYTNFYIYEKTTEIIIILEENYKNNNYDFYEWDLLHLTPYFSLLRDMCEGSSFSAKEEAFFQQTWPFLIHQIPAQANKQEGLSVIIKGVSEDFGRANRAFENLIALFGSTSTSQLSSENAVFHIPSATFNFCLASL